MTFRDLDAIQPARKYLPGSLEHRNRAVLEAMLATAEGKPKRQRQRRTRAALLPQVTSWRVTPTRRRAVFERDGWQCVVCGSNKKLTVDHVRPKSHGGLGSTLNLQTMCARCNSKKGNRWDGRSGVGRYDAAGESLSC